MVRSVRVKWGFMQRIRTIVTTFGFSVFSLIGCTNPVDTNANHIPLLSDDTGAADACEGDGCAVQACDCLQVGDIYRFNTLQLTNVDGDPNFAVIPVLNSLWQMDINAYELNFYVKVTKLTATDVEISVTNAARVGDTKKPCLLPQTTAIIKLPRKGCDLLDSETGSINVYSGSLEHPKNCGYLQNMTPKIGADHAIPIRGVKIRASVSADCKRIENGQVFEGSFSEAALFHLCTCQTTPGQSSDVCITPQPSPADASTVPEGDCSLCGNNWQSLGGLLGAFAGGTSCDAASPCPGGVVCDHGMCAGTGLKYGCKDEYGARSVCMGATFTAERLDPAVWLPSDCSGTK